MKARRVWNEKLEPGKVVIEGRIWAVPYPHQAVLMATSTVVL
jgi:hypothetical protein